ncbi:MAG: helix-turn-helix transcriptional regulator [Hespellia sp.]|nr:helix-turn-helix transcriptional regulator [Hespellia sp.]
MDIGKQIQEARLNEKLTQENVAEALGVSRQTISNWENGKTYPDIVSVVKMSDLYSVSLDCLLKEEKSMSDYLEYLDESTNVVKSKKKLAKLILVVLYLAIWAFALITFWFFNDGSDAMGYGVMFLWVLLPITTFVLSVLIGKNGYWGRLKWLSAVVFGVMYMLAEYATFSVANMKSFGNVNMPEWGMILGGGIVSAVGLAIGVGIKQMKQRKKTASQP